MIDGPVTREFVIERLEEAGATLLALRLPRVGPSLSVTAWPEIVREAVEAYGWAEEAPRASVPEAAAISAMDEAYGWLALLDSHVTRRVLGLRSLVDPITWRHRVPWRTLAKAVGSDPRSVRRWHRKGVEKLVVALGGEWSAPENVIEVSRKRHEIRAIFFEYGNAA